MSNIQDYQVNYTITVNATDGVKEVQKFAEAVKELNAAKTTFAPAIANINNMMQQIEKTFRPNGRKRDYAFKLDIDTRGTEKKLERVKTLVTEIAALTKGISLTVNAGQKIGSNAIRSQTRALVNKKELESQKKTIEKAASDVMKPLGDIRKNITKTVGKINAALLSLEKGREINIKTDLAKTRLTEILSLLREIKGASKMTLGIQMNSPGKPAPVPAVPPVVPQAPFVLSGNAWSRQQAVFNKAREARILKETEAEQEREHRQNIRNRRNAFKRMEQEEERRQKIREDFEKAKVQGILRREREAERQKRQTALAAAREVRQQALAGETAYRDKRRAAINRLQYSRRPSLRSLPMLGMVNAYMAYSFLRSELSSAVNYSNIMESARSILRVADTDLSSFEARFEGMSRHIRKIGVDTKFTAVEIAGAAKFLAMAGMDIATVNASMRPIANLSLIGDNDVSLIADLTTNIMSGYHISGGSMGTVADIITSTISRSNVNVVEMAESFKMAAGYLKLAGVDFSEASAAIGLLGNAGLKGTLAGTALRAMSTRFAKQTKQAEAALDRLGVKFTHFVEEYGRKVEKLRPLADIFKDLHAAGASMEDMITIFSKIGGNAAMQFVMNYDKLRVLTTQNRASHGISEELALAKQNTTKGLWAQVTSTLTESFMQAYEVLEPVIRSFLKDFLAKFRAPEMARGLASIGRALLDVFSLLARIGTWFTHNFRWIEPLLFTGFVATRLFKLAGALTNVGVALGFIGKQSVASSSLLFASGLPGKRIINLKKLSFADKRSLVAAFKSAGISGRGAMKQALLSSGIMGVGGMATRKALGSLFANQVATGSGLTGAAASLSAVGTGAAAATAGVTALAAALGYVAYKTWQVKKAKDAVLEDLNSNEKYRYPSIEALHESLRKTYLQALKTKEALDNVTAEKTLEEESGQKTGAFTGEWWKALLVGLGAGRAGTEAGYTFADAYQENVKAAIGAIARKSGQAQIQSAYAKLGGLSTPEQVAAFIQNIEHDYRYDPKNIDTSLYSLRGKTVVYKEGLGEMAAKKAAQTPHFAAYQNQVTVPSIRTGAEAYLQAISSRQNALNLLYKVGFDFAQMYKEGFMLKNGVWVQKAASPNASEKEITDLLAARGRVKGKVVKMVASLRDIFGGNEQIAENIIRKAGFDPSLYANEPEYNDNPFDKNRITNDADDGKAGGNYSGTGKLSSAAPKQVIVQITNLLSVGTIDLLKSPEGQQAEIACLKEQLAQALIDVVHDFDATWNG